MGLLPPNNPELLLNVEIRRGPYHEFMSTSMHGKVIGLVRVPAKSDISVNGEQGAYWCVLYAIDRPHRERGVYQSDHVPCVLVDRDSHVQVTL